MIWVVGLVQQLNGQGPTEGLGHERVLEVSQEEDVRSQLARRPF